MFRRTTLVIGLAISAWSAAAGAQTESWAVPTPEQQELARRNLAAGQRLLKWERFEAALAKLQAAYAIEPTAAALFGVALAQRETDRIPEAYRSYERLLASRTDGLSSDERERAQRALAELASATGIVKLTVSEPDALVTVDDRPLEFDALAHPLHLSGGRHVFAAAKPGFAPLDFPIFVTAGKLLETSLTLRPLPGTVPTPRPPVVAPPPVRPASAAPPSPPVVPAAPPSTSPPPAESPVPALPPAPAAPGPAAPTTPPVSTAAPVVPPAPVAPPPSAPPPAPPVPVVPSPPAAPPQEIVPPALPPPLVGAPAPPPSIPLLETREPASANPPEDGARVGFLLGVVTLPRPVEGELTVKVGSSFALGVKGGYLPELSVPFVHGKIDLKALEGIVRWFPGDGVFFLGMGFGYQGFKASLGETVDSNQLTITADMSGYFVQPQLGVLWISHAGFAMSLSFGLQIPIPKDPVVSASYLGQPVPAQATSTVPQDVVDQAQTSKDDVQSIARLIVKYPFPTLDLLRIGFFF